MLYFHFNKMKRGIKKGQIWVETVIYTLIAFIMIGLVIAYVKPKVEEIQDKAVVEQSIEVLNEISDTISSIKRAPGNQRVLELGIKKGTLTIDGENDQLIFQIESRYEYTEPGKNVNIGDLIAYTKKAGDLYDISLTSDYEMYDITYSGNNELKTLTQSPTPYSMVIANKGDVNNKINIDITI